MVPITGLLLWPTSPAGLLAPGFGRSGVFTGTSLTAALITAWSGPRPAWRACSVALKKIVTASASAGCCGVDGFSCAGVDCGCGCCAPDADGCAPAAGGCAPDAGGCAVK